LNLLKLKFRRRKKHINTSKIQAKLVLEDHKEEDDESDEEGDVDQHHPPHRLDQLNRRSWENTGVELPVYPGTELYCCVRSDPLNNPRSHFISYFFRIKMIFLLKTYEYP